MPAVAFVAILLEESAGIFAVGPAVVQSHVLRLLVSIVLYAVPSFFPVVLRHVKNIVIFIGLHAVLSVLLFCLQGP